MNIRNFQSLEKWRARIVFVFALAVILALGPGMPVESMWLNCVASLAGADPFVPPGHPFWSGCVWSLSRLPAPWYVSVGMFESIAAAACVAFLFEFVMRFRFRHASGPQVDAKARRMSALLASLIALLCTQLPEAAAAMAPHIVGLAFFLASLVVSAGWPDDPKRWRLYVSAFLSGLCVPEFPGLAWMVMLHGLVWLLRFLREYAQRQPAPIPSSIKKGILADQSLRRMTMGLFALNIRAIFSAAVCLLAGLLPGIVQFLLYASGEAAQLRQSSDVVAVLGLFVYSVLREAIAVLPKSGWVFVAGMGIVPGCLILLQRLDRGPVQKKVQDTQQNREIALWQWVRFSLRATTYVLVFGSLVIVQMADNRWSSFSMLPIDAGLGLKFLFALWIGRWIGSLLVLSKHQVEPVMLPPIFHRIFSPALAAALAAALCLYSAYNRHIPRNEFESRWRFANAIAARLEGRSWLVTEGGMDALALAAANAAGVPLNIIDMSRAVDPVYRKAIAHKLRDPALRELCEKDIRGMISLWALKPDAKAESSLAVLRDGAFWQSSGHLYVPSGVLYLGASGTNEPSPEIVWRANEATWRTLGALSESPLSIHAARVANDCGVWMLRHGKTNQAAEAFAHALSFDPDAISPRLNLVSLGRTAPEEATKAVAKAMASPASKQRLNALRVTSGFLVDPHHWMSNGWTWAETGRMEPSPVELTDHGRRIFDLLAAGQNAIQTGAMDIARQFFETALSEGGGIMALEESLLLDLLTENLELAEQHAGTILKTSPDNFLAQYALGYLNFMKNKFAPAEAALRASIASRPTSYAWSELSRVLWAENRPDEAIEAAETAIAMSDRQANAWRIKGMVLAKRGNVTEARTAFTKALARDPKDNEAKDALAALPTSR